MPEPDHLLDSLQMARFAADGFLRFDELVPSELNEAAYEQMVANEVERPPAGTPFSSMWADTPLGEVFRLPAIQGIKNSLIILHF